MFQFFADLLFPKRCVGCQTTGTYICLTCLHDIAPAEPIPLTNTLACFSYHDKRIKDLLWKLKYHKLSSIADSLGPVVYDRIFEEITDLRQFSYSTQKILLIPVPLSARRYRERGFNQAEALARALARQNPEIFEIDSSLVHKVTDTKTQVSLKNRPARLANLRGAFAITKPEILSDRIVIIIDDVITTGSTVTEIRKLLPNTRAVYALALAHG